MKLGFMLYYTLNQTTTIIWCLDTVFEAVTVGLSWCHMILYLFYWNNWHRCDEWTMSIITSVTEPGIMILFTNLLENLDCSLNRKLQHNMMCEVKVWF